MEHTLATGCYLGVSVHRLTVERVTFISLFLLLFAMATRVPIDTDTWWHIRSGEHTLTNGFIYEDPFSFTRNDAVWINHSWGSQLAIYWVYTLLGNTGLALFTAALATGGMAFVYAMCDGNTYLRAFAIVLGASAAAVFWSPRPQMFSFFFSTIVLYLLLLYKHKGIDRLWWLPVLMLLWGNMHAGYSIAFIFMGGVIAGEIAAVLFNSGGDEVIGWRGVGRLIVVSLVSAAVIMITPYGYRMLLVPFQTVGIDVLRNFIQEWQSPNFQEMQVLPFVALLLFGFGLAGASKRRVRWSEFILFAGTAYMGLVAGRNIAVFAVVATPILTYFAQDLLEERGWIIQPRKRVPSAVAMVNALLLILIAIGALVKVGYVLRPDFVRQAQEDYLPVRVTQEIAALRPEGHMFNSYNWGGYLMWRLPEYPVFVDGRTDLYGNEFLSQYIDIYTTAEGWEEKLASYDIGFVAVEVNSPLDGALEETPGWSLAYEDEQAVLYLRDLPQ